MENGGKIWQKARPTQGYWAAPAANNDDIFGATDKRKR